MIRPTPPGSWPITDPVTAEGKQAARLHSALVAQFARVEQVEANHDAARAELRAAEEAIAAADTARATAKAERRYAAAKDAVNGPWSARLEGPVRGCHAAESELREFVDRHLGVLLSEPALVTAAEAARESVLTSTEAQGSAFAEWRRVAGLHGDLVALADGIDGRAIPELGTAAVAARSAADGLLGNRASVPMPHVLASALKDREAKREEAELV